MTIRQKMAILSISLLSIMSSATVSPVLPDIAAYFPDASELMIKMVVSLPGIFIIPVALWTGILIHTFHKKNLIILGVTLYLIGGLGGALATHIIVLLLFRGVMGIGVGFLIPLARSLIADFFDGKERNQMMGYSTSVNNLGGIIATVVAGALTIYGWRYPFLVYTTGFLVLGLVLLYLPHQDIHVRETSKAHINTNVWLLGFGHFMMIQVFFAVPTDLGFFVEAQGYGGGFVTGILIAIVTVGSLLMSMIFHTIKETFKGMTITTGLLLLSIGMLGIGLSTSLWMVGLALLSVGCGLGIVAPSIYLQTSLDSSPHDITLSLAVVSAASFLGQFSAPIIMKGLTIMTGFDTISSPFILSFGIGIVSILAVLLNKRIKFYVPLEQ